ELIFKQRRRVKRGHEFSSLENPWEQRDVQAQNEQRQDRKRQPKSSIRDTARASCTGHRRGHAGSNFQRFISMTWGTSHIRRGGARSLIEGAGSVFDYH